MGFLGDLLGKKPVQQEQPVKTSTQQARSSGTAAEGETRQADTAEQMPATPAAPEAIDDAEHKEEERDDDIISLCVDCSRGISGSEYKDSLVAGMVMATVGGMADGDTKRNIRRASRTVLQCSSCGAFLCPDCAQKATTLKHQAIVGRMSSCQGVFTEPQFK